MKEKIVKCHISKVKRSAHAWFPPELENGKAFSSQGNVREFCQDWKSQGILLIIL